MNARRGRAVTRGLPAVLALALILATGLPSAPPLRAMGGRAATVLLATRAQGLAADSLWRDVGAQGIGAASAERIVAGDRQRTLLLDTDRLSARLRDAPQEFTAAARAVDVVLELPWPDGSVRRFRIQESPVMEPALAAQFPDLKTYSGEGIEDPSASLRFDWTPNGFHAMVLSGDGTVYIDPFARGDVQHYVSYFFRDYRRADTSPFSCRVAPGAATRIAAEQQAIANQGPNGTELRTYRLAVAATGEYTAFYGGTVSGAMNGIVTTMNRVDGLYERDVAVRMTLVGGESSVIYTNAGADPYTNNSGAAMLSQNQSTLDSVIGSANYDIGHVFSTGGGGIATVGVVCAAGSKAQGVTGSSSPIGDGFDVDYVAHEIGHQFNANHTFNGTTSNCGGGNRAAETAYEPGSGSTIMAYAGICGAEDLQPHSDAVFHAASQSEIINFITDVTRGGSCPIVTSTGNSVPTVSAGPDETIPSGTPFTLTASASDADPDTLSYAWEEFDLGAASPPNTDDGSRPIFRSFEPSASPARTFPKISDLVSNTSTIGESLPTTTRAMTFRVTVRDNRVNGGGTSSDDAIVHVDAGSGPFVVTAPNTAVSWTPGTTDVVTWNVANTTAAPVNAASVRITLSTDGGLTFPFVLAANTPNDGGETITVPNLPTTTARVRVEAVGNIFFDISNTNFTILSSTAPLTLQNPDFSNGTTGWQFWATPNMSYLVSSVSNGVFQYYRVPPPAGTANEAEIIQATGLPLAGGVPILAQFDLGNSDGVRKRMQVLIHDLNFSELTACSFFLPAHAPLRTYRMRTHTINSWANTTISFYAMSAGSSGGGFQVDNVSLQSPPTGATDRTECLDPTAPGAPGGPAEADLLTNGDFDTGSLPPWTLDGGIIEQIVGGIFDFNKVAGPAGTRPGVILQPTGQAMPANQILTATFQLGNSGTVRKRVKVLLHDLSFDDMAVCSFWLGPGQSLRPYTMRTFATQAWANATLSVYPLPVGADPWIQLDAVTLQRTPAGPVMGTECLE